MTPPGIRMRAENWQDFIDETTFFRLILDHVSECFVAVDVEGHILHINEPYCALLGKRAEECLGHHVTDVVSRETKLHLVAQGAPPVIGGPLTVRGQQLFTRQVPVRLNNELLGAVGMALFSDFQQALSFAKSLGSKTVSLDHYQPAWVARHTMDDVFGTCPSIASLRAAIRRAARTDFNVVIRGETGTGKELVANALHTVSARNNGSFVPVNCGSIPGDLVESELFGYESGAFTGAKSKGNRGKIEIADGGTLFLDEIGDLPMSCQAALLRVLETGELQPLGAQKPKSVDLRVVCATHHDLRRLAEEGRFRSDLLYRLDVLRLEVPPLRERGDIADLAGYVLNQMLKGVPSALVGDEVSIAPRAVAQLEQHSWPGNVRELRNVLQRAVTVLTDGQLTGGQSEIGSFPELAEAESEPDDPQDMDLQSVIRAVERTTIARALSATNGNKRAAAERLGIDRTTLYKKMRDHGIV